MTTAYTASNSLPMNGLPTVSGIIQKFVANTTNSDDATYAPDGLSAAPIFGLGAQQLQGNEIVAGGTVTLESYIGPLLNSGAVCWVLLECEGGAQQVALATQSQHAVQFGQLTGLAGAMSNAKMSVAAASATATFTADQIIVGAALNGLQYSLANFNKTINLTTVGAGGMDIGTAPLSGYVALYAIYNPTTGASNLLAVDATSAIAPIIYSNGHMPPGYTASALVSVWPTNASRQLTTGAQVDRWINRLAVSIIHTSTTQESFAALNVAVAVPRNARRMLCVMGTNNITSSTIQAIHLAVDAQLSGLIYMVSSTVVAIGGSASTCVLNIATPQTIFYQLLNTGGGTPTFDVDISGYEF